MVKHSGRDSRRRAGIAPYHPRVAVGLGNPQLELRFLPRLDEWEEFTVEVCVHATDLLSRMRSGQITAVLISSELPGLSPHVAAELALSRAGVRGVLLAEDPGAPVWQGLGLAAVLPLAATADDVCASLRDAIQTDADERANPAAGTGAAPQTSALFAQDVEPSAPFAVMAFASGAGSPGRTTVALGLATALGAVAPTVLVDADLTGPSLAVLLDADPRRNLFQLAYGQPETPEEWEEQLAHALQPLAPRSPQGWLLCGLATQAMRARVSVDFFNRTVAHLQSRFRYVILDLGADLLGSDHQLHRRALQLAAQVLLVTTPDLTDLRRAQVTLGDLDAMLGIEPGHVAVIVNRYDRRRHPGRRELEWGLGHSVAALVPYDYAGIERAKGARRSVVLERRSRARRALLELAGRIHGGRLALPAEPTRRRLLKFHPPLVHRHPTTTGS